MGHIHKFNAYKKAIQAIKSHPQKIHSGNEARALDGIGPKIEKKIQEILDTGGFKRLREDQNDPQLQAVSLLSQVSGIGPVFAHKLVYEQGVLTLEDLVDKDIKLNHHQQLGLQYFQEFKEKIPRAELQELEKIVVDTCRGIDPEIIAQACGSYRRELPFSGDVDILLTHPNYTIEEKDKKNTMRIIERLVEELEQQGFLIGEFNKGSMKYMGVCKLPRENATPRRIDLKLFPVESFYFSLLHFTGSGEHNRRLREVALKKGFTLSEYSICPVGVTGKKGEPIIVNSEEEIFELLDLPFKEPKDRSY